MSARLANDALFRPARESIVTLLDFESTGRVGRHPDEPWQLGLVRFRAGRVADGERYDSLLRVGARPFNRHAPGRYAALRAELAVAPLLPALWPSLRSWLTAGPLCAHNAGTERRFIRRAFPLQAFGPWIDTLPLARAAWPGLSSYALEELVRTLGLLPALSGLRPGLAPHDAAYDAVACGLVLERLLALPGWEQVTLAALVQAGQGSRLRTGRA